MSEVAAQSRLPHEVGLAEGPDLEALSCHLLQFAVATGDFVLKSGRRTGWYIDAKQTACRPEGMLLMARAALDVIPDDVTALGGLTMGADPVAFATAAVAATSGRALKAFSVRAASKVHGKGGRIAGAFQPGDRVAITEDTVTRGTSALEAAQVVREAGGEPLLIVALVDRGGMCKERTRAAGIGFRALVSAPDLGFTYDRH